MSDPTFSHARYAKGKISVRCPSDGTGNKTRAMRLANALRGSWSNREKAYIMTPGAAVKLKRAYDAGQDAFLGERNGILDWVLR